MITSRELALKCLSRLDPDEGLVVRSYLEEPLDVGEGLHDDITAYIERLRSLSTTHPVNLTVAEDVAIRCRGLLDRGWAPGDPPWVVVQAAVRYFLAEDDAQDDIGSMEGFDDDERVVAAVEEVLGTESK